MTKPKRRIQVEFRKLGKNFNYLLEFNDGLICLINPAKKIAVFHRNKEAQVRTEHESCGGWISDAAPEGEFV